MHRRASRFRVGWLSAFVLIASSALLALFPSSVLGANRAPGTRRDEHCTHDEHYARTRDGTSRRADD